MAQLSEIIRDYEFLKAQRKEIEEQAKSFRAEEDRAEDEIIRVMMEIEQDAHLDLNVAVDGRKYSISSRDEYSFHAADKDKVFKDLREIGLGDLIVERVEPRSLTKVINEGIEANGGKTPTEYINLFENLNRTPITKLYSRKV